MPMGTNMLADSRMAICMGKARIHSAMGTNTLEFGEIKNRAWRAHTNFQMEIFMPELGKMESQPVKVLTLGLMGINTSVSGRMERSTGEEPIPSLMGR